MSNFFYLYNGPYKTAHKTAQDSTQTHHTSFNMFYVFCVKTDKDFYTKNKYETFGQLELSGKARPLERQLYYTIEI